MQERVKVGDKMVPPLIRLIEKKPPRSFFVLKSFLAFFSKT